MSRPCVLVIDVGLGNIGSVIAALQRLECDIEQASRPPTPEATSRFTHTVLPGVGSFAAGMDALRIYGWEDWIKNVWSQYDRPFLGICLGMQLLATTGEEGAKGSPFICGLDLIPGHVAHLKGNPGLPIPHVGWNAVHWQDNATALALGLPDGGDLYFVHSFVFQPIDSVHILAITDYKEKFISVVGKRSFFGVQFHPEKSQKLGSKLLANFLAMPCHRGSKV